MIIWEFAISLARAHGTQRALSDPEIAAIEQMHLPEFFHSLSALHGESLLIFHENFTCHYKTPVSVYL
jgi:hypothetical protein